MASVDMSSIMSKVNSYVGSDKGKRKIQTEGKQVALKNALDASEKFIEVLRNEINGSDLSTNVKAALDSISHDSPRASSDGTWTVNVYFTNDMARPSLDVQQYGYIDNLAKLYDRGAENGKAGLYQMNRVWGTWHGQPGVGSRTEIRPTNFMRNAREKFMSEYADKFGVTKMEFDSGYSTD